MPKRRDEGTVLRRTPAPQQTQEQTRNVAQSLGNQRPSVLQQSREDNERPAEQPAEQPVRQPQPVPVGAQKSESPAQPPRQPRQVQFDDDDLDVPDFLK